MNVVDLVNEPTVREHLMEEAAAELVPSPDFYSGEMLDSRTATAIIVAGIARIGMEYTPLSSVFQRGIAAIATGGLYWFLYGRIAAYEAKRAS